MTKLTLSLAMVLILSGCANMPLFGEQDSDKPQRKSDNRAAPQMHVVNIMSDPAYLSADYNQTTEQNDLYGSEPADALYGNGSGNNSRIMTKHVGDYVQNMTQDLISNMEYLTDKTPVGVTNFALIDSNLQRTNLLGFQLTESFMHELHKFRIPVIDFKATDYIRVTEQGDFLLSRDFLELTEQTPIEYILTGTLTKHQGGYIVNARILGLQSKAVVASAQMLMPFYVVDALLPSEHNMVDGVQLTQGE
ncbi:FlgO family outer membrane protein [Aliiglaciecola lipolytica]|uniref:Lipoprotein, putative n=1 Tax=Aliiglaciecola lipolytica E3 TaxID=1127673 RepID=K6YQ56_9ALTE|nr:FlgO family outer membrane protein [Aliiglaciecola lipolytica]GAC13460.1 lipoprotein, putative [Aliiglaciecola lipolytica E3]